MNADQPIYCSQCGQQQGFGQHGYSHCRDHTQINQAAARELLEVMRLTSENLRSWKAANPGIVTMDAWLDRVDGVIANATGDKQ